MKSVNYMSPIFNISCNFEDEKWNFEQIEMSTDDPNISLDPLPIHIRDQMELEYMRYVDSEIENQMKNCCGNSSCCDRSSCPNDSCEE